MKLWKCKMVNYSMLEYYTPGVVYEELCDGTIATNNHSHYVEWSSFCHNDGVIVDDGDEVVIFCEIQ